MAHTHEEPVDTIFCLEGRDTVSDLTNGADLAFEAGQAIHVPAGVEHAVKADRGSGWSASAAPLDRGGVVGRYRKLHLFAEGSTASSPAI